MELRPYQQMMIDMLFEYLHTSSGNPCGVAPTGSGKSVMIAHFIKKALADYPDTRILVLAGVKELLEQNYEKIVRVWPNSPAGIYSAGLNKRQVDRITFAGIQSIRDKYGLLGKINIVIVDEAHGISHKNEGSYRVLINNLKEINPKLRVIGFTATPFRLGHGMISEGDAIFDDLIEPVSIPELINAGYLSRLVSRATDTTYDMDGVHKRGGEYIEKELQERVDTDDQNKSVASEIVRLAGDRKAWIVFCSGVKHAHHMRDELIELGISTEVLHGGTPNDERDRIVKDFKEGKIRAITNVMVLSTGFDYPDVDLIALLRPTMSPGLYLQQVGRGMRIKSHTNHCLVLDFAGVIQQHGPITNVVPPDYNENKDGKGNLPPGKECPECHQICHAAMRICPNEECMYVFPEEDTKKALGLRDDDIMGELDSYFTVYSWNWVTKFSKSGNEMVVVSYYGSYGEQPLREYLLFWDDGYAGKKARIAINEITSAIGTNLHDYQSIQDFLEDMNIRKPPIKIQFVRDGKYKRVIGRVWNE